MILGRTINHDVRKKESASTAGAKVPPAQTLHLGPVATSRRRMVHDPMLSLIRGATQPHEGATRGPRDELVSLAAAFVEGDVEAARTLVSAVSGRVLGVVRMILGPGHCDVEDVTQDALIGLLEGLRRFRGECTIMHFAGRVAVLTAMAARRRQRTREHWVVGDDGECGHVSAGASSSPLAHLEATRRRDTIRRLLDELPEPTAEAVALHFILGYTVQEIAVASHVPVNTVWSRLRIGKDRIRAKLADDPSGLEELTGTPECGS